MKMLRHLTSAFALLTALGWVQVALADTVPVANGTAAQALSKDAVCTRCHDESESKTILALYQTRHGVRGDARAPGCQDCHGASEKHVKGDPNQKGRAQPDVVFKGTDSGYEPSSAHEQAGACLSCHKGGKRAHWAGSQHEGQDMACPACHKVHVAKDPVLSKLTQAEVCYACHKEQRAQMHRISTHPVDAGKIGCSDCHNPHGATGAKLLVKNSVNETCYTCHAEKRGPFLWEHGPVADDCTNCHTPHGSTQAPLLKARAPWLCQECHSGDHGNQVNSAANLAGGAAVTINGINPLANAAPRAQVAARGCLNCHVLVHGSNHPAGSKFQR
jgi:DmsE family decaheme c-type cytochrome